MCLRSPYSGIGTPPYEEPPQQSPYISAAHQYDKIKRARADGRLRRYAPFPPAPLAPVPEIIDPEEPQFDAFIKERPARTIACRRGARTSKPARSDGMNGTTRQQLCILRTGLEQVNAEIAAGRVAIRRVSLTHAGGVQWTRRQDRCTGSHSDCVTDHPSRVGHGTPRNRRRQTCTARMSSAHAPRGTGPCVGEGPESWPGSPS